MATIPPLAREAIEHARRHDFNAALATARRALEVDADDAGLQLFVGLLHARRLEFDQALPHFRAATALNPADPTARLELARTLVSLGDLDESERLLAGALQGTLEARKLRATILSRRGEATNAVALLRSLVAEHPNDFESWSSLGIALLMDGRPQESIEALDASLRLRPDQVNVRMKWVDAHIAAGSTASALVILSSELRQRPADTVLMIATARLRDRAGQPDEAMAELERAVQLDPGNSAALTALAELQERHNRIDGFAETLGKLRPLGPREEKLPLLEAQLAYRRRDLDRALQLAESAPPSVDVAARAQLIGNIRDRIGDSEGAWEAFAAMNRDDALASADALAAARRYRLELECQLEFLTDEWRDRWTMPVSAERTPAFLFGFPRSGTTLLDTFLMGLPAACVSEENPLLPAVSAAAGDVEHLPTMTDDDVKALQQLYWREADGYVVDNAGRLFIDKFPFGLVAGPYVHRLFPKARILFVERHPCDVVLSCYFTRFQPTGPGASFVDLVETAKLYDGMMRFWTRSCELLGLQVHAVRYERLVEDSASELRPAAEFLGLEWTDVLVDHRETASRRGFIKTPSYAQVAEPLYSRSVARWRRYGDQMQPVLDVLGPWTERLGYPL